MSKTSYLGYVPKKSNVTKLQDYISKGSSSEKLPNPKPVKLNKNGR